MNYYKRITQRTGAAIALGLLLTLGLLTGMALAQEPAETTYWLILDPTQPTRLAPLVDSLAALKANGIIDTYNPEPQANGPGGVSGLAVTTTAPQAQKMLPHLPGVLALSAQLPPTPPQLSAQGASGTLTGQVTDEADGTPVVSATVFVYDAISYQYLGYTDTNAAGLYTISVTSPYSAAKVTVSGYPDYEDKWYQDKETFSQADEISLSGGPVSGINFALTRLGLVTGTITKEGGTPLATGEDVYIWFYQADSEDITALGFMAGDGSTTTYSTTLSADRYKVEFDAYFADNLGSEWYNDQDSLATANVISVVVPTATTNINADLPVIKGGISGTVTSLGSPVEDAAVYAFEVGSDYFAYMTYTTAGGYYHLPTLDAGQSYQISFSKFPSATTWYNDTLQRTQAATLTVNAGQTVPNIDGSLDNLGACILGRVVDQTDQPVQYAEYQLYDPDNNLVYFYIFGGYLTEFGITDEDGGFNICGLAAGPGVTYVVQAQAGSFSIRTAPIAVEQAGGIYRLGDIRPQTSYLPLIEKN